MNSVLQFQQYKDESKKIVMATCYNHWGAKIMADSAVDCILVGDSVAMVEHGLPSTVHASLDMMVMHVASVARASAQQFIVADMPFLTYRKGLDHAMNAVEQLMQAGANAIKLEGVQGNVELIRHIVESGVPVMGHIGLMPQSVNRVGGYKVQGRDDGDDLLESARSLQAAGCFSVVIECVPEALAGRITGELTIPTIGIGAGKFTDGQVLVFHDMLGLNQFNAKFIKRYVNGRKALLDGLNQYSTDVVAQDFPADEHSFQ